MAVLERLHQPVGRKGIGQRNVRRIESRRSLQAASAHPAAVQWQGAHRARSAPHPRQTRRAAIAYGQAAGTSSAQFAMLRHNGLAQGT